MSKFRKALLAFAIMAGALTGVTFTNVAPAAASPTQTLDNSGPFQGMSQNLEHVHVSALLPTAHVDHGWAMATASAPGQFYRVWVGCNPGNNRYPSASEVTWGVTQWYAQPPDGTGVAGHVNFACPYSWTVPNNAYQIVPGLITLSRLVCSPFGPCNDWAIYIETL